MKRTRQWIAVIAMFIGLAHIDLIAQESQIQWKPRLFGKGGDNLKQKLGDLELVGDWIYDDLNEGFRRAEAEGKPLMVVFRCVRGLECRGIDGQVVRREDHELKELLEKFICVRVVRMWGIDLSLFRFDGNLTWVVFFMNADKTIYGRYGTRSAFDAMKDISLEGFKKTAQGALALHAAYPSNKQSLIGKTAETTKWRTPEEFPAFAGMYQKDDISVNGCLFFILTFDIDSPEARNYRKNLEVEVTATRGVISPSPDTIYG